LITAIRPARFPWFDYSRYTFSLGLDLGGGVAMLSGHTASEFDPERRTMVVRGTLAEQVRTAYSKIEAILEAAGLSLADIVRVVEYVTVAAIDDYPTIEDVRRAVLKGAEPAVNTVCVSALLRPEALLEIEVVAKKGGGDDPLDGVVYLPSLSAPGAGDLVAQAAAVYDQAASLLSDLGLALTSVTKTVDYCPLSTLPDYRHTGSVRKERLGPVHPGATGVLVERLRDRDALIQVDFTASRHPLEAVNPGWGRYGKLTYSPAVKAGRALFMSGQAALDPGTEKALFEGDVVAQADYTYGNIAAVLKAAGLGPENLVKTIEYVVPEGLAGYRQVAEVRARHLAAPFPASTGLVIPKLLRPEFLIEIDPLAILP
jgi:enamine deaminase RidA (YjgF/YER057c/UK114 family)